MHRKNHFEEKICCEVCKRIITGEGFERHWRLNHLKDHGSPKMKARASLGKEKSKETFLINSILFVTLVFSILVMIVNHDGPFICDKCGEKIIDRIAFFEHLKREEKDEK